jgi:hypothetical protein
LNDHELRSYLLGRLPEADAQRLEERLLADQETFETLRGVEDDLIDDYARERLDEADRRSFLERYGAQRGRVGFARALHKRQPRAGVLPFTRRQWFPMALAAALAIAAIGIVRAPGRPPEPGPAGPGPVAAPAPVSIVLTLGTSRSAAAPAEVTLAKDAAAVGLRVRLDPADRFDRYAMELRSPAGQVVWRGDDLRASGAAGEPELAASVPATALQEGAHELAVRGGARGAPLEELGFTTLRVRRSP